MKKRAFFICSLLFLSTSLQARTASFNAQNFRPATDSGRYFGVYGSQVIGPRQFSLGLTTDYATSPIGLFNAAGVKTQNLIEHEISMHLSGTYGFLDWLDAGVLISSAPYLVFRPLDVTTTAVDESANAETRVRMGDLLLNARLELPENDITEPVELAFIPFVTIPTGSGASFVGNNQFSGGGILVIESPRILDHFSVALNTGYEIRKRAVLATGTVANDLFLYGLAGNLSVHRQVDVVAELRGFTMVGDFFGEQRPMEWEAGAHYLPIKDWKVSLGIGTGLIEGLGNPTFRLLAGVAYQPTNKPEAPKIQEPVVIKSQEEIEREERLARELATDTDGDTVWDKDDLCPTEVGLAANSGCPDKPKVVIILKDYRILTRPLYFDSGKATLRKAALPILQTLAGALKAKPTIRLLSVEGHTDGSGSPIFNQRLSEERAKMVVDYLISQGVETEKLTSIGFGKTKPLNVSRNKKAQAKNRRVEFVFKKIDGISVPEVTPSASQSTLPESGMIKLPPTH